MTNGVLGGLRPAAPGPPQQTGGGRRLLLAILAVGAAAVAAYLAVGALLMTLLPAPDGGKQGLRLVGTIAYGAGTALVTLGAMLLTVRLVRGGMTPWKLRLLARVAVLVLVLDGFSGLTIYLINRETPLMIDIIAPLQEQGWVAPIEVTFGTETLRSVLAKKGLFPVRYRWDFDGDGKVDVEQQETEVTTVYRRKGIFRATLILVLSDGTPRVITRRISIPYAVFAYQPTIPLSQQPITFSVADLLPPGGTSVTSTLRS